MADCEWALLCDYTFRDVGQKVCLIGIFDRIFAKSVPATHHQAALVFRLTGTPNEKVAFKLEIVRPTNAVIGTVGGEATIGDNGTADVNVNIGGLLLPDWGTYSINVHVDGVLSKAATFNVQKAPEVKGQN